MFSHAYQSPVRHRSIQPSSSSALSNSGELRYAVKIQKKSERNRKSQIRVLDLPAINFPAQ
jgi:hypothetical protein